MTDSTSKKPPPWAGGQFSKPIVHRRFAVGDVHGCCRTLRAMVEDVIRLGPDNTLYLLGDYIDRGPDSKGVLDYLIQLWHEDYDIRPLLGNHEEMLLMAAAGDDAARQMWFGNGGWGTMQQLGAETPADIPQQYIDFLTMLPRILTISGYVFVHAGLDFRTSDPILETSPTAMLWERDYRVDPAKLRGCTLVCGHTVRLLSEICQSLTSSCVCLDNGCYDKGHIGFGNLVAFDLDTRELLVQNNCD